MPTPESEMFLAQKPKVPPTFDGVDYDDTKAFKQAQDAIIREQWVGAMMLRLVGEELGKCYKKEGVNHLENCGHLREFFYCTPSSSSRFLGAAPRDDNQQRKPAATPRRARLTPHNMICRTCLRRASAFPRLQAPRATAALVVRPFSISAPSRNAAAAPDDSTKTKATDVPPNLSSLKNDAPAPAPAPISSCPAGTVLNGLNYFKGRTDPVALRDEEYPEWLWTVLESKKVTVEAADDLAAEMFSKSKKQRKAAAKRQKAIEAKLVASGDVEALAPKVPLPQQSINLPGEKGGDVEHNLHAATKRDELRKAMRTERKAKIKESNYLKS
ncbi:NADH-ubiquinone oxidoreductase 12 kDa subunit, partial [Colletotrichum shisoi]